MIVEFTVPGQPVGKGRPRIGKVGAHARMFTPEKTVNYEGLVAHAAHQAMAGRGLITGPVDMQVEIVMQIPASWSAKKQRDAAAGLVLPATKPDCSNVIKAVEDGMNGVVYKDDAQIVGGWFRKRYGAAPGVQVSVTQADAGARQ